MLGDPALRGLWEQDMLVMAGRIATMRHQLHAELTRLGTPSPTGSWQHVVDQVRKLQG